MYISVLVPSYRRPRDLERCLQALSTQTRPPDQLMVVLRSGDDETFEVVRNGSEGLLLEAVEVTSPGVVHALNAGLDHCNGDILAILDDDAAPRSDWLARIEAHYVSDPTIGAVGGRDWIHNDGVIELGDSAVVGKILWFGRIVHDHHRGVGPARDVQLLKGANWSFRTVAIRPVRFDTRLRGSGAQVYNEMLASLGVKRAGWRLIYDPEVTVNHFLATRHDRDQRQKLDLVATSNRAFNLRLAINEIQPDWLRMTVSLWQLAIGISEAPGLAWLLRHRLRGTRNILAVYRATMQGWREGGEALKAHNIREFA